MDSAEHVLVAWTAHPAKRRPRDVALVSCVMLLFCGATLASLQSLWLTLLAAVILAVSVAPFLLPTHYRLTAEGVSMRRLGRQWMRHWRELRRVQIGGRAALVSPFAEPNLLDRYRGMVLHFDGGDRRAIIEILREKIHASE